MAIEREVLEDEVNSSSLRSIHSIRNIVDHHNMQDKVDTLRLCACDAAGERRSPAVQVGVDKTRAFADIRLEACAHAHGDYVRSVDTRFEAAEGRNNYPEDDRNMTWRDRKRGLFGEVRLWKRNYRT